MRGDALLAVPVALMVLAACSGNGSSASSASPPVRSVTAAETAAPLTAEQVTAKLQELVPTAESTKTYTAANDPNHLLGRPNGYSSKAAFADSRVPADQVEYMAQDAVERGGSVEVFADEAGAKARMQYIQTLAQGFPGAVEYDYVHGAVLVRVSRILTPDQAKDYEAALQKIGG